MSGQFSGRSSLPSPQESLLLHTKSVYTHTPFLHLQSSERHSYSAEQQTKRFRYDVYLPPSSLYSSSLHFHLSLSSLHSSVSSFSFIFVITASHHFHQVHSPFRVSFIHLYRRLHSTLSSHPLTSTGTPSIDIITSIYHHLFRSLLLPPPLFL